jgi:predicted nucleic acid-binding Zn ribbon protein
MFDLRHVQFSSQEQLCEMWSGLQMRHEPRACLYCGSSFIPRNSRRVYCSNNCRIYAFNQRKRYRRSEIHG